MADLRLLKQWRAQIKVQVTRIQNYFENTEEVNIGNAQVRLESLKELCNQFEEIQTEIEGSLIKKDEQIHELTQEIAERTIFEDCYFKATAKAQAIMEASNKQHNDQVQALIKAQIQAQFQTQLHASIQEENQETRNNLVESRQAG